MTNIERTFCVLRGKKADRTPVCLINFQPACVWAGMSLKECFLDGEKLAYTQIAAWEDLDHDVVHIQNGIAGLSQLLGCEIQWKEDDSPWVIGRPSEDIEFYLDRKIMPDLNQGGTLVGELVKAVRIVHRDIGDQVVVRPEADLGPFALGAELIGIEKLLIQLSDPAREEPLHRFLDYCTELVLSLCRVLKEAGAGLLGIGEGAAGPDMIAPKDYVRFAKPYHKRLASRLSEMGIPLVLHICGNAGPILDDMVETGSAALELDQRTDRRFAAETIRGRAAIFGNLSPQFIAFAAPQEIFDEARQCIRDIGADARLIIGPGCDLPPNTPFDNACAIVEAAKTFRNSRT